MQRLVLVALIGFVAQFVDGAMGMAYGVTSSSLLLMAGFSPAAASASLHLAEVATTLASGTAHYRLGNVDRTIAFTLALPGAVGAFLGAVLLTSISGDAVKPVVSGFLFSLGLFILVRFARQTGETVTRPLPRRVLTPLGLVAGLCDAIGGGGWGPIVTTTLLARSAAEPRAVVGSVGFSEAAVAVSATLGFALTMGWEAFQIPWVLALMIGGVLAAPVAAWIVGKVPRHILGVLVGSVILISNLRTLARAAGAGPTVTLSLYIAIVAATAVALTVSAARQKRAAPPTVTAEETQATAEPDSAVARVANLDG